MGRKRREQAPQESTTTVLREPVAPETVATAKTNQTKTEVVNEAIASLGIKRYDKIGNETTKDDETVAEVHGDKYFIMFVSADLYDPTLHSLNRSKGFLKMRKVSADCFNDYFEFLKTKNQRLYRQADNKATFGY